MDQEISRKLADAVSGRALPISIKNDSTGELKDFVIKQPTFELLIETSRILSEIGINEIQMLFEGKNVFTFILEHGDKVLKVISIILDRKVNYSQETFDFLRQNLTPWECYDLLSNIILRIGTQDFQKSIIEISPMSLFNQREIIALLKTNSTHSNS
jgi:hypothetical protein